MTKKEALEKLQKIFNEEFPNVLLDGVDTPYPKSNWKTATFVDQMDRYSVRHPENDKDGVDYVFDLCRYVIENPEEIYYSKPRNDNQYGAWILKRWSDKIPYVGMVYMKIFDIDTVPVIDIHPD